MKINQPDKAYNTEEKIMEAAKKVFVSKGKAGTRMQEIADEAGINKSLLHYYYRSKEKLFGAVFKFAFSQFAPKITKVFSTEKNILEILENIIDSYIEIAGKNPFIPMFIINEFSKGDSSFVTKTLKNSGININLLKSAVDKGIKDGIIKEVDPRQLIINTISLCLFPFVARPILQPMVFEDDHKGFDEFLSTRKQQIYDLIIKPIKL